MNASNLSLMDALIVFFFFFCWSRKFSYVIAKWRIGNSSNLRFHVLLQLISQKKNVVYASSIKNLGEALLSSTFFDDERGVSKKDGGMVRGDTHMYIYRERGFQFKTACNVNWRGVIPLSSRIIVSNWFKDNGIILLREKISIYIDKSNINNRTED